MKRAVLFCYGRPDSDPRQLWFADSISSYFDLSITSLYQTAPFNIFPQANHNTVSLFDFGTAYKSIVDSLLHWHSGDLTNKCLELVHHIYSLAKSSPSPIIRDSLRLLLQTAEAGIRSYVQGYTNWPELLIIADWPCLLIGPLSRALTSNATLSIYDAHEYWPEANLEASISDIDCLKLILNGIAPYYSLIVTVTEGISGILQEFYSGPIYVVPNYEPKDSLSLTRRFLQRNKNKVFFQKDPSKIYALFIGGMAVGRGLEQLINQWHLTNENYVLCMQGPSSVFKSKLISLSESSKAKHRILWLDTATPQELESSIIACDVGLIPYHPIGVNHRFCSPNKLGQFLKHSKPIIACKTSFVQETILRSSCGALYEADSASQFTDAFRKLEESTLRDKYAHNARTYYDTVAHWENYIDDIPQTVMRLVNATASRPIFSYPLVKHSLIRRPYGITLSQLIRAYWNRVIFSVRSKLYVSLYQVFSRSKLAPLLRPVFRLLQRLFRLCS